MNIEPSPFSLTGFVKLVRLPNLLIIVLTQYAVAFFLISDTKSFEVLQDPFFHILALSTVIIASAGYMINDYYDVKIDLINKPERVIIGQDLKRRPIMILHVVLNAGGVTLGFLVSWKIGVLNFLSAGCLWFYSNQMKRWPFVGNLSVALLTSLSLFVVGIYFDTYTKLLMVYCFFALIMTLVREIIKDIEDQRGDQDFGCYTLPIALGMRKTKGIIFLMLAVLLLGVVAFLIKINNGRLLVYFSCLSIPFLYFLYKLAISDAKKHFSQLSLHAKLMMLSGILSMVFV